MKKIICIAILCCGLLLLCSCDVVVNKSDRFEALGQHNVGQDFFVLLYRDTHTDVLYQMCKSGYGGGLCPVYNSDGTLMTYSEWIEGGK